MGDLASHWPEIRRVYNRALLAGLHATLATVGEDGTPHATPIGSLRLKRDCTGVYFEMFTRQMPANLAVNQQVCVLAVNSGKWFWIRSLMRGRFIEPPGIRLIGNAGERRPATDEEIAWWQRRVRPLRFTSGYEKLWSTKHLVNVRELHFTDFRPLQIGEMTQGHWGGS